MSKPHASKTIVRHYPGQQVDLGMVSGMVLATALAGAGELLLIETVFAVGGLKYAVTIDGKLGVQHDGKLTKFKTLADAATYAGF